MRKKFFAFTLAEVLITLGIIGVVAAITIPTLMNNYQKKEYVTALKKFYTNFNQALKLAAADKGCVDDLACTGMFAAGTTAETLGQDLSKYFKISKDCGVTTNSDCWPDKLYEYYEGHPDSYYNANEIGNSYNFVTLDGMSVGLSNSAEYSADCAANAATGTNPSSVRQICGHVYVDVNGRKGPNKSGRDVFNFAITNGKGALLYPDGGAEYKGNPGDWSDRPDEMKCGVDGNTYGGYCAGRVMDQGWDMKY